MEMLKKMILEKGKVSNSALLKVDSFLNHQIDPNLMYAMGEEFKKIFGDLGVNKVLTIEASGIAIGVTTAHAFQVPLVFAKKNKPATMEDSYNTVVRSFTKNKDYNITVAKEFLNKGDKVLVVDDFLAMGNAILGLKKIVEDAGAEVVGVGIAVEKGFQDGSKILRDAGINLHSLAIIDNLDNNTITLR